MDHGWLIWNRFCSWSATPNSICIMCIDKTTICSIGGGEGEGRSASGKWGCSIRPFTKLDWEGKWGRSISSQQVNTKLISITNRMTTDYITQCSKPQPPPPLNSSFFHATHTHTWGMTNWTTSILTHYCLQEHAALVNINSGCIL